MLHLLNALSSKSILRHVLSATLDQKMLMLIPEHLYATHRIRWPLHASLCYRGRLHIALRGWSAITRTPSLHRPNCSNVIFQGVVWLPMDQQGNVSSFILGPSIKTNRFEEDFIPPSFLHSLQLIISREQKEVANQSTSPSSSFPIATAITLLREWKSQFLQSCSGRRILEWDKKQRKFSPYVRFSVLHAVTGTKPTKILILLSSGLQC